MRDKLKSPALGLPVLGTTLAAVMTLLIAGCNKPQGAAGAQPPSTTAGIEIGDSMLATSVKSALLAHPDVRSLDIEIETRKGEVQLSGFVDDQTQIDRAIAVTREVPGVRRIENKMSLGARL